MNDTLEQEIKEEIYPNSENEKVSLIDPIKGNKVQSRIKVASSITKTLESSGSIFTGRDESSIIKQKRRQDAIEYQRILKEQIEEKKRRIQTQKKEKYRDNLKTNMLAHETGSNSNSNNNSKAQTEQSPGFASSRYSNSNTACTRNLFTPSEDNCLSQHLANYNTHTKERVIQSSDTNQIPPRDIETKNSNGCSTVLEENPRDDTKTEDSIFSLKPVDNDPKPQQRPIMVEDQDSQNEPPGNLEDMIDVLIKEQQQLKDRMKDQENILNQISNHDKDKIQNPKVPFLMKIYICLYTIE